MSQNLPTVTIKTENGPVVINMTDYNPDKHELIENYDPSQSIRDFEELEKVHGKTTKRKTKPKTVQPVVAKRGDKFFIVDKDDKDIVSEHVVAEGYETEELANGAIAMLTLQG